MKKRMVLFVVCSLWSVVFLLSGCGYTTRSAISSKYRTIYITPFINKIDITQEADAGNKYVIYRPQIETDVTRRVVNRFLFDGNLKPVKEETADVILKGEVVEFRKDPVRYASNEEDVEEYRVNLIVNISLWNRIDNKLIWEENRFTGQTSYFVTGNQAITEAQAVTNSLDDLGRRIVERAVESW